MSIPNTIPPSGGWPVVIFQHNLGRDKYDLFRLADVYGEAGCVGIATDALLHGDRRTEPDQEALFLSGTGTATAAHTLQSLVDLSALTRFVGEALPEKLAVNPSRIYLHAESGGGIIAAPHLAFDPRISGGILSFVGGNLPRIATENTLTKKTPELAIG